MRNEMKKREKRKEERKKDDRKRDEEKGMRSEVGRGALLSVQVQAPVNRRVGMERRRVAYYGLIE